MNTCKIDEKFQLLQTLGKGAFSVVYKVKRAEDNHIYALKKVSLKSLKEKEVQNALNEIRILASIKHPSIVAFKEAFVDRMTSDLCIVMEFAGGGDLSSKIRECREKRVRFPENTIIRFFYQLASALYELHVRKIIHRDLKTANVFLTSDLRHVKLGDMNVSKIVKNIFAYTQTGTPYYASPEVWRDEPYSIKTDVWSLGCVMYELCMLKPPFNATDMDGLFERVQKCAFEPFDSFYSNGLRDAIARLLTLDCHQRPSCEKILNFSIFGNLKVLLDDSSVNPGSSENLVFANNELIETIKPGADFFELECRLPRPQYSAELPEPSRKGKLGSPGGPGREASPKVLAYSLNKPVTDLISSHLNQADKFEELTQGRYKIKRSAEIGQRQNLKANLQLSKVMTKQKRRSDSAKHFSSNDSKTANLHAIELLRNSYELANQGNRPQTKFEAIEKYKSIFGMEYCKGDFNQGESPRNCVNERQGRLFEDKTFESRNERPKSKTKSRLRELKQESLKGTKELAENLKSSKNEASKEIKKSGHFEKNNSSKFEKKSSKASQLIQSALISVDNRSKELSKENDELLNSKIRSKVLKSNFSKMNDRIIIASEANSKLKTPSLEAKEKLILDAGKLIQPHRQILLNKKSVDIIQPSFAADKLAHPISSSYEFDSRDKNGCFRENRPFKNAKEKVSAKAEGESKAHPKPIDINSHVSNSKMSCSSVANPQKICLEGLNVKVVRGIKKEGQPNCDSLKSPLSSHQNGKTPNSQATQFQEQLKSPNNQNANSKQLIQIFEAKKHDLKRPPSKFSRQIASKSKEKDAKMAPKKKSANLLGLVPNIGGCVSKFRIKSSKEANRKILEGHFNLSQMHKSNLLSDKFNQLYGLNGIGNSNSIELPAKNGFSLGNNFSIGLKKKSDLSAAIQKAQEAQLAKSQVKEPSNLPAEKLNDFCSLDCRSKLNKGKKSVVNIRALALANSSNLFKKQEKPVEVTEQELPHCKLPSLNGKRSSNPGTGKNSSRKNIKQNEFVLAGNGLARKVNESNSRALSAGIYQRQKQANFKPSEELGQIFGEKGRAKFILKKKLRPDNEREETREQRQSPVLQISKSSKVGKQLNMEQFVKFINQQYIKRGKDARVSDSG